MIETSRRVNFQETPETPRVRVELDTRTLHRLLNSGLLCAADFRCLDCDSKNCVWRLCLQDLTRSIAINPLFKPPAHK